MQPSKGFGIGISDDYLGLSTPVIVKVSEGLTYSIERVFRSKDPDGLFSFEVKLLNQGGDQDIFTAYFQDSDGQAPGELIAVSQTGDLPMTKSDVEKVLYHLPERIREFLLSISEEKLQMPMQETCIRLQVALKLQDLLQQLNHFDDLKRLDTLFHKGENAGLAVLKGDSDFKEFYDSSDSEVRKIIEEKAMEWYAELHYSNLGFRPDFAETYAEGMPEVIEEKIIEIKSFAELMKLDKIFHDGKNAGLAVLRDDESFKELYDSAPAAVKKFLEEKAMLAYNELSEKWLEI